MANPTGRTYHYGEHNPLTEDSGPRAVYRPDVPLGGSQEAWRWEDQGAGGAWGEVSRLVSRYPVGAALVALAAGFLGGSLLSSRR